MFTIPSHGWFMALPTLWDSLDIAAIAIPNTTTSSNGFPAVTVPLEKVSQRTEKNKAMIFQV